jgi:fumarylacetoacetase
MTPKRPQLARLGQRTEGSDFPIQNLPFGVFHRTGSSEALSRRRRHRRPGARPRALARQRRQLDGTALDGGARLRTVDALNDFLAIGPSVPGARCATRLFALLKDDAPKEVA